MDNAKGDEDMRQLSDTQRTLLAVMFLVIVVILMAK